ncbi:hypothetical protein DFQ26_009901, partial [Actinomortierella ambigua]
IAPSLRLLLVGDTGIGKTAAQALFLETVPGQITASPSETKNGGAEAKDEQPSTDDTQTQVGEEDQVAVAAIALEKQQQEEQDKQNGFTQGRVSTLSIPHWLATTTSTATASSTTATTLDNEMVSAQNIVLHDFVGYGQHPNARLAMDKVEAHLTRQYQQTRQLFGPAVSPFSTNAFPSTVTVVEEEEEEEKKKKNEEGEEKTDEIGAINNNNNSKNKNDDSSFLLRLLEGGSYAHTLPDACLYFILYDLKPVDIEFMKRIMHQVNLIPVLAKADTLSAHQLWRAKQRILGQLQRHQIEFFRFGYEMDELVEMAANKRAGAPPFALSTAETSLITAVEKEAGGGGGSSRDSLRDLAIALNTGEHATTNSDLSLLQALLLGSKNRMLHRAAAQKFVDRWQIEVGPDPTVAAAAAAAAAAARTATQAARPLSTAAEEVAQVVKLSRAQSVMRRSPSIKNFHNGALVQDGPVPSVPLVNSALLTA